MIAEPDSRPRLTERRILCGSLVILLLLLFVGAVVGLVTWYKAQQTLVEVEELWKAKLIQCQAGRLATENRLVTMASKIGCLFEENSAYHQAAHRGLMDATSRTETNRQGAEPPANKTTQGALMDLKNVELDIGNISISNGSLAAVQQLYRSGVRLFIGFEDSDDLLSVLRWARRHAPDAVFVSPSATATDLAAGPSGPLLLSLSDAALAAALLCLLRQQGVKYLIPVVADNTYGRSLVEEVRRASLLDGSSTKLLPLTLYKPSTLWDRSDRQALINSLRKTLAIVPRRQSAAFLFIAGPEMRVLLEDAGWDSELSAVPWFGTDAIALRRDILSTEAARQAAIRVNLTAVIYTGTDAAGGADQWEVLQQLRDLTPYSQPAAPNILRAYEGAALLAELGKLVVGHGDTGAALGALRTVTRAGATGASAMEDGTRRAGGHFTLARVVAHKTSQRQLLTDSSEDAVWVVTGQVRLTADPQRGIYLSRAVYSAAGSAHHLVRRRDVAAVYEAAGGCEGDSLSLSAAEPAALSAVDNQLQLRQMPNRLLVPAGQPVRVELHCAKSDSGLLHLTVRCPAVQLPDSDTVFCLADTYRLRDRDNAVGSSGDGGLRWRHQRHLFRCGAASAACLDNACDEHTSCVNALADEIGGWLSEDE